MVNVLCKYLKRWVFKYFLIVCKGFLCREGTHSKIEIYLRLIIAEEILKNPSLKVLAEHIDHYIWPGPMPSCVEEDMKKAGEDIFYNGVDIDTALDKAQADIIKDMKNSSFQSVENLYKFAK